MPSFTLTILVDDYEKLLADAREHGYTDRYGMPSPAKMAAEIVRKYYEDD